MKDCTVFWNSISKIFENIHIIPLSGSFTDISYGKHLSVDTSREGILISHMAKWYIYIRYTRKEKLIMGNVYGYATSRYPARQRSDGNILK